MILRDAGQPGLIGLDYDGTIFKTSETAPDGTTVNVGYAAGLEEVLGVNARDTFLQQGGHNHRAPGEIVLSIAPDLNPEQARVAASQVVRIKLEMLENAMGKPLADGTPWPRVTDGFVDLWNLIQDAKDGGEPVGTAIISNGHTSFQQRTFDMLGLPQPDIYVTDDVLGALALNVPLHTLVKPRPFMFDLARQLWTHVQQDRYPSTMIRAQSEIYAGDDGKNDRALAKNADVDFVHIIPEVTREGWKKLATLMNLGDLSVKSAESGDAE